MNIKLGLILIIAFCNLLLFDSNEAIAQNTNDSTAIDSILLKQIELQMQESQPPVVQQPRSGLSFNPDIGVIGDFQSSYNSRGKKNIDAYLNETEMSLQAVIDPYARADFFVSFSRDPATSKYSVGIEEGYLTSLSLPARLQLRVGKFKEAVGRINPVHAHALPFIDLPNAYVNYFGDGLNDEGFSLSWLLPNKKFYQELIVQATSGFTEAPAFSRIDGNRFVSLAHLKNFFTINENTTFELGLTGISGPNVFAEVTNIGAADLTYKWKPIQLNTYHSFTWQSEFYYSNVKDSSGESVNSIGLYTFLQYQVAKRWFLTGRYDYAQKPYDKKNTEQAYSLTAGWLATEFQKIEIEGKTTNDIQSRYYQVWLRWIFVIGAHGAHQY